MYTLPLIANTWYPPLTVLARARLGHEGREKWLAIFDGSCLIWFCLWLWPKLSSRHLPDWNYSKRVVLTGKNGWVGSCYSKKYLVWTCVLALFLCCWIHHEKSQRPILNVDPLLVYLVGQHHHKAISQRRYTFILRNTNRAIIFRYYLPLLPTLE